MSAQTHRHTATHKGKGHAELLNLNVTPFHSYALSLAIWDHTVLPATQHK